MNIDALGLLATFVLENGERWGALAHDNQWLDAFAILDPASATPFHFLTRARGWSKTTDLAALLLAVMICQLPPGARLYGVAASKDQARLLLDAAHGFIERTPLLRGALMVQHNRVILSARDIILEVVAADAARLWGRRPHFFVVDELAQWPTTTGAQRVWEATRSAMAKIPGARLVVITTAGDPAHWAYAARNHAVDEPLWRLHEVPGPPPWADPARLEEQRRSLPLASYERLFNNSWTSGHDRLTTLADLQACIRQGDRLRAPDRARWVIGVDIGVTNDRTVAAVCYLRTRTDPETGRTTGTTVVIEAVRSWRGTLEKPVQLDDVEEWLYRVAKPRRAEVVVDPYQATLMSQHLSSRGIHVETFTFSVSAVSQLALTLHQLIRNHDIELPDRPELIDELANVRLLEPSPGVYRLDHDAGQHDDHAIAVGIAAHQLIHTKGPPRPRLVV